MLGVFEAQHVPGEVEGNTGDDDASDGDQGEEDHLCGRSAVTPRAEGPFLIELVGHDAGDRGRYQEGRGWLGLEHGPLQCEVYADGDHIADPAYDQEPSLGITLG